MKKTNILFIALLSYTISSYTIDDIVDADSIRRLQQSRRTETSLAQRQTQFNPHALQERLQVIADQQQHELTNRFEYELTIRILAEYRLEHQYQPKVYKRTFKISKPLTWEQLAGFAYPEEFTALAAQLNPQTDLLNLLVRAHPQKS